GGCQARRRQIGGAEARGTEGRCTEARSTEARSTEARSAQACSAGGSCRSRSRARYIGTKLGYSRSRTFLGAFGREFVEPVILGRRRRQVVDRPRSYRVSFQGRSARRCGLFFCCWGRRH